MKASQGEAPGKCILFGEHAVVYGYPALAAAIEMGSFCQIAPNSQEGISWNFSNFATSLKWSITDDIPDSSFAHFLYCLQKLAQDFSIEINNLEITISSHLWSNSGLGSSASSASAFIKAINNYYSLELTLDQLNEYTLYMEGFIHGTPSGLDNSTVNYGGVIHFQKGIVRNLDKFSPIPILIVDSGIAHDTKEAIIRVKDLFTEDPNKITNIFENISSICEQGILAIKSDNLEILGALMNKNHKLLQELNLSTPKIEEIRWIGDQTGIFGSKITGAGLGGAIIAVGSPQSLDLFQDKLNHQKIPSILTWIKPN